MSGAIRAGFRGSLHGASILPETIPGSALEDGAVSSTKIATNLQSDNYNGTDIATGDATQGWRIERNTGSLEGHDLRLRGTIIGDLKLEAGESIQILNSSDVVVNELKFSAGNGNLTIDNPVYFNDRANFEADGLTASTIYDLRSIVFSDESGSDSNIAAIINSWSAATDHSFSIEPPDASSPVWAYEGLQGAWGIRGSAAGSVMNPRLKSGSIEISATEITDGSIDRSGDFGIYEGGVLSFRNSTNSNAAIGIGRDGTTSQPAIFWTSETNTGLSLGTLGTGLAVIAGGSYGFQFIKVGSQARLYGTESNDWYEIDGGNEIHQVYVNSNEVARFGDGGSHGIRFPGRNTTTNSGLAAWRNDGFPGDKLLALSSSRDDKTAVRDPRPGEVRETLDRLRSLRPRMYRSKANADDGRRKFLGIVKEEAREVWPDWTYEAMTIPMFLGLMDLDSRVSQLESRAS